MGDSVLPPGETVMIALAAASHDPARFPRAGDFDIHRTTPVHLAFGHGIHYCLGAPLARVQVSTALRVLLALRLAGGADRSWRRTLISRGVTDLPVQLR
ncbi:cytochrome P450 [Amycolatopsis azurea]|uniref:cytochrome P450 n=1 Tax=Amycolatopsis azurea TaxID=36819 RepID=UPI00382574EB